MSFLIVEVLNDLTFLDPLDISCLGEYRACILKLECRVFRVAE